MDFSIEFTIRDADIIADVNKYANGDFAKLHIGLVPSQRFEFYKKEVGRKLGVAIMDKIEEHHFRVYDGVPHQKKYHLRIHTYSDATIEKVFRLIDMAQQLPPDHGILILTKIRNELLSPTSEITATDARS